MLGEWLSSVRFELIDSVCDALGDSLCFSGRLGFVLGTILPYREVNMASTLTGVCFPKEGECQVIESGPEIVNCVTDDEGYFFGNDGDIVYPKDGLIRFKIELRDDFLSVAIPENVFESVEILDVLFGPLQFGASV
jgi:hypothetical protein